VAAAEPVRPIRSGLSAAGARIDPQCIRCSRSFVFKKLPSLPTPQHVAYDALALAGLGNNAPRLIATIPTSEGTYLVFEYVMRGNNGPGMNRICRCGAGQVSPLRDSLIWS
jgi:hypothetical protein